MKTTLKKAFAAAVAVSAFAATAAERVELLDIHQEETNRFILSYTYQTLELSPAMTYQLVTTVKVTSGLPGARKWQFKVFTNDVTAANAVVTTNINLEAGFGADFNPDANVNLSLIGADATPVGTILDFMGDAAPNGYLLCDGAEYPTNVYARLYAVIGTKCGTASDGFFKVPNFTGRVSQGLDSTYGVGKEIPAGIPDIYGTFSLIPFRSGGSTISTSSAFSYSKKSELYRPGATSVTSADTHPVTFSFWAHSGERKANGTIKNDVYGKSDTVQPAAVAVNKIIKY